MKFLTVSILSVMVAFAQAATVSWLTTVPLLLMSISNTEAFFGLFRRRKPPQMPVMKDAPDGPVQFPASSFPSQGANGFNPFGGGSYFPGYQNAPSFFGGHQGNNFKPQQTVRQPWFPPSQNIHYQSHNIPSLPQTDSEQSQFMQQSPESEQSFDRDVRFDDQAPAINTEEAESFFTLLAETDENKCISRLVCEIGADPGSSGDLVQTISEIISSLTDFPPGSKVSEYNDVLRRGRERGISSCLSEFPSCDQETYLLMKSNQPDQSETESVRLLNMPPGQ